MLERMKTLTITLVLLSTICSFGQNGDYCGKKTKLTMTEIKKRFPFDKTHTIKLVSFKHNYSVMQETDSVDGPFYEPEIPKTNGIVDFAKMFETKTLDRSLTDKLLDILINYDNEDRESEITFCYEPRNGIVFLDGNDKIIGFVEICFECLRYKVDPPTLKVGSFCSEKFNALKRIFKESGISYGTVRDVD
jgi:hypothetical protein